MSAADSLRREAASVLAEAERRASALLAIADELDNAAPPIAGSPAPARDELVSLTEAANAFGVPYDTAQNAASRKGAIVKVGQAAYVWRSWLNQLSAVRSVRSVAARLACEP